MKKHIISMCLLFFYLTTQAQNIKFKISNRNLIHTVEILTSDSMGGRSAGSGYDLKTAQFIERELSEMGYVPLMGNSALVEFTIKKNGVKSWNVVMTLKSALSSKNILIGAHYDHLGIIKGEIYRGANDNASGVASLLEIARNISLKKSHFKHNIVICAFGAEENEYAGSKELVEQFKDSNIKIDFMFNLEMLGVMSDDKILEILGDDTFDMDHYIAKTNNKYSLNIRKQKALYHGSDHYNFVGLCPVAIFATTEVRYYHHPKDDISEINFLGLGYATHYAVNFIYEVMKGF